MGQPQRPKGTLRGTHNGVLSSPNGDVAPTGRALEFSWAALYVADGETLMSEHLFFGQLDFLGQLGLLPARAEPFAWPGFAVASDAISGRESRFAPALKLTRFETRESSHPLVGAWHRRKRSFWLERLALPAPFRNRLARLGQRGEHVAAIALELRRADARDLRQLTE
jgi:hypothetical protein